MKRKMIIMILCCLSVLILGGCGQTSLQNQETGSSANKTTVKQGEKSTKNTDTGIGMDKAVEKALAHAGLTKEEVTLVQQNQEYDDGVLVYEIEFVTDTQEYDYELDGITGEVLKFAQEAIRQSTVNSDGYMGVDAAKELAVAHAGFAANEVTFIKDELDVDDNQAVYEIEFVTEGKEYEYTIHASSGDILEYDVDHNGK